MKKGFTLIELLAVIVILAIIGVITVPIIGNVIEESKKEALEASVRGIVDATDYFAISNDGVYEFIFDENNKGVTLKGDSLDYTGSVDAKGKLILDREGNISLCLMNEKYYAYKNYNSGIVIGDRSKDSCNVGYDVLTNKYIAFLESVGSASNVYSKDEVDNLIDNVNTNITTNTNEITNIKSNIETLQNSLNDYALKSELQETNTYLNNVSQIVTNNRNDIDKLNVIIEEKTSNIYKTLILYTEIQTIAAKGERLYEYEAPIIDGYTPVLATINSTNHSLCFLVELYEKIYQDKIIYNLLLRNTFDLEVTAGPSIKVLYIKNN